MKKKAIIIFAKYPDEGKVKSRLAETTGNGFAAELYKITSKFIFNEAASVFDSQQDCFLFYSGNKKVGEFKNWVKFNFSFHPQANKDLGNRMMKAFETVFNNGYDKVVIIGTDVPDLTAEILNESFTLLEDNDVVIGPSYDGGYYLLGMKQNYPELFSGIEWSTEKVFEDTLQKCRDLIISYSLLGKLHDIDTEEHLKEWLGDKNSGNIILKEQINILMQNFLKE